MTRDQFGSVRHFTPDEWQPIEPLSPTLVYEVDAWREWLGKPVIIHEAFALEGHVSESQHALGVAVDCHVVGLSVLDAWLAAERWSAFRGIGLYPYRKSAIHPEGWEHPGLHLDVRDAPVRARWYRTGTGEYGQVTESTLTRILYGL